MGRNASGSVKRRLTTLGVKSAPPGHHGDGFGLWLAVTPTLVRSYVYRFTIQGRSREMGLGSVEMISLADARAAAQEARKLAKAGIDPIEDRKAKRGAEAAAAVRVVTFDEASAAYVAAQEAGWKNQVHRNQWTSSLKMYASPVFGALPVGEVDQTLILKVLEPIWATKTETAARLRGRIERVLDYAASRGLREGANPAAWQGRLELFLPQPGKIAKTSHHNSLPYPEINAFVTELRQVDGTGARALEFLILTATRTSETLGAKWSEIDVKAGRWIIPAERMKAGKEHRVALSAQAIELLRALPRIDGSDFVFPSPRGNKTMSNMAMIAVLKRMDRTDITPHGFRASFRNFCAEISSAPSEIAEIALAHTVHSKVEAAYYRTDQFQRRIALANEWGSWIERKNSESKIVILTRKEAV